ncbi:XRE family transcriptional regulator [Myceligenerans pegani]|uniref:XRE family transcriptional regulator n=1 Tax=Myceligenerans pegani TaxID=2776917 RepID=A0ABR9MX38_9MICO|nr:XRE family transcriptional regulator [Myceligenerans sp. TRM 65318]MBE1875960.1 XRE family transcriptional regulator [Myceligenerans sp. TRM 65318]MBE3018231.1 XRE family transcriptional regulator [Myceligenerans sp. TRM 65318]
MTDLRAEREAAGLTQKQLAELTGIAQSNLSAYESGRRHASPAMLERIRHALRRPADALDEHRQEIRAIIARHGARNPRVFGSVARGQDTSSSDLDILVSVPPGAAWTFGRIARDVEELLGVHVDVVSEGGLDDRHREILDEAVPL